jgi:hypothetical protein
MAEPCQGPEARAPTGLLLRRSCFALTLACELHPGLVWPWRSQKQASARAGPPTALELLRPRATHESLRASHWRVSSLRASYYVRVPAGPAAAQLRLGAPPTTLEWCPPPASAGATSAPAVAGFWRSHTPAQQRRQWPWLALAWPATPAMPGAGHARSRPEASQ